MRTLRSLLPFALAFCVAASAYALDPERALSQYGRDTWQTGQGLPQNTVYAIAQDEQGYLWLGTAEGIVRFDGARFTVFDRRNTPAIPGNVVAALATEPGGALWVGTEGGIARYQGGSFTRPAEFPSQGVTSLCLDRRGRVWAGTASGAFRIDAGRVVAPQAELAGGHVRALAAAADGAIWIGFDSGGLVRVRDDSEVELRLLPGARISSLLAVADGSVWVGVADRGLVHLGKDGAELGAVPASRLGSAGVSSLYIDRHDVLWVGLVAGGLVRIRGEKLDRLSDLPDVHVRVVAGDAEGSVWIGTLGAGLTRLRDGAFLCWGRPEGLGGESVRLVSEDAEHTIWIGTEQGTLSRLRDGAVIDQWTFRSGSDEDGVYSIAFEPDGSAWVGTFFGLSRLVAGRVQRVTSPLVPAVHALLRDPDGTLWAGTFRDGLWRLRTGERGLEARIYSRSDGLPNLAVMALARGSDGALWLGTAGGGVARLVGDRVEVVAGTEGAFVYGLLAGDDGSMWAGTVGKGLAYIKGGRAAFVTSRQGLFDDVVYSVSDDGRGNLWLPSNRGIFRVARHDLEAVAAGGGGRLAGTVFDIHDGMRNAECNSGGRAGMRDSAGRMWFATMRGAVAVDPDRIPHNDVAPLVQIERMLVDGRPVVLGPSLVLPPGGEQYELQYTATSLRSPDRARFRYRLQGLDTDWVSADGRRVAYYSRLPYGRYAFEVMATNEDGVASAQPARIELEITPRFRETRLFFTLAAALAVAGLAGAHRLRVRRMQQRQSQLESLIAERTAALTLSESQAQQARAEAVHASQAKSAFLARMSHELRTPLNVILGFVQLMLQDRERAEAERGQLGLIARSGEHLLRLINDVLSLAKIESGRLTLDERDFDLRMLLRDLEQLFHLAGRSKGVDVVLDAPAELPPLVCGDDGKLRQVLVNLLGNAIKFSTSAGMAGSLESATDRTVGRPESAPRGRVVLRAGWNSGTCTLEVEDNGPGVAPAERARLFEAFVQTETGRQSGEGTGLGLAISHSFVHVMGGRIEYAEGAAGGALFRVQLPLAPAGAEEPVTEVRPVTIAPGQRPRRLLVVDDNAGNRHVLRSLLEKVGFLVSEAADGGEAIRVWHAEHSELVWMDLLMAPMDGYHATQEIRRLEAAEGLPRTPILALTASSLEHERAQILAAGCDDVLYKPFRASELWLALERFLGVRFLTDEPALAAAPVAAVSLEGLPDELRAALLEALVRCDVQRAGAVVDRIGHERPELADRLRSLIRAYRFEEILAAGES